MDYKCAFCQGKGIDPYRLLSPLSTCQVCSGRKKIAIEGNTIICPFCGGDGEDKGDSRVTCLACRGKGRIAVSNPRKCTACNGSGKTKESKLTCLKCKGHGFVSSKL